MIKLRRKRRGDRDKRATRRDDLETPRGTPGGPVYDPDAFAQLAERLARFLGTGRYLAFQTIVVALWIFLNGFGIVHHWDPYPFILLNLFLSMLAAIQAPVIMMSQNRQDSKDRVRSELDFDVNRRAELGIQGLSRKLNILDDTLVFYIVGDNGASAEGTLNGAYNEMANFNGLAALETSEFLLARLDKLGGRIPTIITPSAGHMR